MSDYLYKITTNEFCNEVIPIPDGGKISFEGESLGALFNRTFKGMGSNIEYNKSRLSEIGAKATIETVGLVDKQNGVIGTVECVAAEPL